MRTLLTTFLLIIGHQLLLAQNGDFVETNGVRIYYETHGAGEPLLLLHGFTLSHKAWDPWVEDLSQQYQLIIPDLRGHGLSTNPSKTFTLKESAKDMLGLLDALGLSDVRAMGQSGGAMTLMHMATMDSSSLSAAILVAGTTVFDENTRKLQRATRYEDAEYMEEYQPGGEDQIRMIVDQFKTMAETYDDMSFTPPYLGTISCPTLIIHGDRDPFFSVDIPATMHQSIPDSYLWVLPNEGHIPGGIYTRESIWSDVMLTVISDFFAGNWDRGE